MRNHRSPHKIGRKRRIVGWTLISIGLLIAAMWAASAWWMVSIANSHRGVVLAHGTLAVVRITWLDSKYRRPGFHPESRDYGAGFEAKLHGFRAERTEQNGLRLLLSPDGDETSVLNAWVFKYAEWDDSKQPLPGITRVCTIELWFISLPFWLTAAPILRSGNRARRLAVTNACRKCGYSLAGLADGSPCPECGKCKGV